MKLFLASLWAFDLSNIIKKYCNEKKISKSNESEVWNKSNESEVWNISLFSILIFIQNFGWVTWKNEKNETDYSAQTLII